MKCNVQRIIKDWFTGPDGETHDPARFLWFVGVVVLMIFSGVELYRDNKFNVTDFAFAYSSLLAAGAAGIKIKESTEPPAKPTLKPLEPDADDLPKPPKE